MTRPGTVPHRPQSLGEEIANSVSHGVGFLAAVAVLPILILGAVPHGPMAVAGASAFGASMALLYLTSTLYHALAPGRAKQIFQVLDHGAIYLLIAGTYTPFTLGVLRGPWGWTLFGLIWCLALAGIILKAMGGIRFPRLSIGLYLGMGWLAVVAAQPLWLRLPAGDSSGSRQAASPTRRVSASMPPADSGIAISSGTCSSWPARLATWWPCRSTRPDRRRPT